MLRQILIVLALGLLSAAGVSAQEPFDDQIEEDTVEEDAGFEDGPALPEEPVTPRDELFLAIELRDVETARRVLREGAEDQVNLGDPSPLGTAALHNDIGMVQLLLDFGGNPNATEDSPLEEAIRNENTAMIQLLMQAGARVPTEQGQELFRLAQRGDRGKQLSGVLIDQGASADLCLAAATSSEQIDYLEYCLERGAEVESLPRNLNILGVALRNSQPDLVARLLDEGLDDRVIAGALVDAITAGDEELVRIAVERGAKPAFPHFEAAVEAGNQEIAFFLLEQTAPSPEAFVGGDIEGLVQRAEDLRQDEVAAALRKKAGLSSFSLENVLPVGLGLLGIVVLGVLLAKGRQRASRQTTVGTESFRAPVVKESRLPRIDPAPPAERTPPSPDANALPTPEMSAPEVSAVPPAPAPPPAPALQEPPAVAPVVAAPAPDVAVAAAEPPSPQTPPVAVPNPEQAFETMALPADQLPIAGAAEAAWEMVPEVEETRADATMSPVQVASEDDLIPPRMPEVDLSRNADSVFRAARQAATGETVRPDAPDRRQIVLVTPARTTMLHPCPAAGSLSSAELAAAERTVPSTDSQNIAVIAFNDLDAMKDRITSAIPFFNLLSHLGYLGHAVWIFEGHVSAMAAGCTEADVLIVDDGMVPYLPGNWRSVANRVMRGSEVFLFERKAGTVRRLS